MVAPVAFPLAKLGVLLVKQISKPLAKRFANRAKNHRLFRDWVCIPIGQVFHYCEARVKLASLDVVLKRRAVKVPRLSEKDAIEQGSTIMSEALILVTAIAILVYEYKKSREEKKEEEELKKAEREMLKSKLFDLETNIERQSDSIFFLAQHFVNKSPKDSKETLQKIIEDTPNPSAKAKIEPLKLLEDIEGKKSNEEDIIRKTSDDKSLTEEFVEFVEEVVEEVLDTVNPEDHD